VSITGGEPLDQPDFDQLIAELKRKGLYVNVQTSGMRRVNAPWDWCTVSPKGRFDELALTFAQELKVVYTGQSVDELGDYYDKFSAWNYYLQPVWQNGAANEQQTMEKVFELNRLGMYWEFTAQWHKHLGIK
jgi:organic radical activating enzyme